MRFQMKLAEEACSMQRISFRYLIKRMCSSGIHSATIFLQINKKTQQTDSNVKVFESVCCFN